MMALPEIPDVATIDCKTSFFFAIENKLRDWKLIAKYAMDSRVQPFLARTDEIIDAADRAHSERTNPAPAELQAACTWPVRSEEHTSELPSLMRISYAVFCLKKKKTIKRRKHTQL